jgi:O-acetyl-ADP-ribose deacetylase (regulator of RNase III)
MSALVEVIREHEIRSVAIPPLGSGLGGLDWRTVRPVIENASADLAELHATVHEPGGGPTNAAETSPGLHPE